MNIKATIYDASGKNVTLQALATLSMERKLVPLELLIYKVTCLSVHERASTTLRASLWDHLISKWYDYFNITLSTVKKMGLLQSMVHHLSAKGLVVRETSYMSFAIPSHLVFSRVLTSVRNILMSWPDTPISVVALSVISSPREQLKISRYDLGSPTWWISAQAELVPARYVSLLTRSGTPAKRTLEDYFPRVSKESK